MKIKVKVKLKAKEEKCEKIGEPPHIIMCGGENDFAVFVKETPIEGRANEAVIRILAKYFGVSKSQIKIVSGLKSRQKVIEIS